MITSVLVSGQQANGSLFSERTKKLVVNAHGALIQLREPVLAGQQLRIKNLATNEEVACTVVDIGADRATFRNWELPSRNRHQDFDAFFSAGTLESTEPGTQARFYRDPS